MDVCTGVGTGIDTRSIPLPNTSESSVKQNPVPGTSSVWSVRHKKNRYHHIVTSKTGWFLCDPILSFRFLRFDVMNGSVFLFYVVRYRKIRWDKLWFENAMAQVRFRPKIWRLGPPDSQIETASAFLSSKHVTKLLRRVWYSSSSSATYTQMYE